MDDGRLQSGAGRENGDNTQVSMRNAHVHIAVNTEDPAGMPGCECWKKEAPAKPVLA